MSNNEMYPEVVEHDGIVTVIGTHDVDTAIAAMNRDEAARDEIPTSEAAGQDPRLLFRTEWVEPEDDEEDPADWLATDTPGATAVPSLVFG